MGDWDQYCIAMNAHGAEMAGVFGKNGQKWGNYEMKNVTDAEMDGVAKAITAGSTGGVSINGKKAIVMECVKGSHLLAKSLGAHKEGGQPPLWHCVMGKTCVYVAACSGPDERKVVELLDKNFQDLKRV